MSLPALRVSERLRDLLAYEKLAGAVPRVLILRGQYWLDAACTRAARRMGWDVQEVPVVMEGSLSRSALSELLGALGHFRPDFILSINLSGMDVHGLLAQILGELQIPHVSWFVDNPRTILMGRDCYAGDWAVACTWDRAYTDCLRRAGFRDVIHLPLAADLSVFNAEPAESWTYPPTFVGNSNALLAEREWAWIAARPELAAAVSEAFEKGRVTRETFAMGLEGMLPAEILSTLDEDARRHAEYFLFTEGTRRVRRAFAGALDDEGIVVRGDDGWKGFCSRLEAPLAYEAELPGFYRGCEVNLNVTSIQMPGAVNQRVFDCPAAGGFLLSDGQADMESLFEPGSEAVTFSTFEECRHLLRFFRSHPASRREVVERARRRILGEHTYEHRLRRIESLVREVFCR